MSNAGAGGKRARLEPPLAEQAVVLQANVIPESAVLAENALAAQDATREAI